MEFKLDIEVQIVAKLSDKEFGDNEFSYREVYFMNDFDEYVDEDNIDDVLNKADDEKSTNIEEYKDKDSIIGIQAFHFRSIIVEYIYYEHISNSINLLELWICKIGLLKVKGLSLLLSAVLSYILFCAWFVFFLGCCRNSWKIHLRR